MEDNTTSLELSESAQVFVANLNRLGALSGILIDQMSASGLISRRLNASEAARSEIGKFIHLSKNALNQANVDALQMVLEQLLQVSTEATGFIKSTVFLHSWMLVMLVTFAEAYLEDALDLLMSNELGPSTLPPVVKDMKEKWIKDILRSGNPHKWVKELKKFGATGYSSDLPDQMSEIWKRRHEIVHSANPDMSNTALTGFLQAATVIASFVAATDAYIMASKQRP